MTCTEDHEFQESVDQQDKNLSRLQTRAQHLIARVAHLGIADFHLSASAQRFVRLQGERAAGTSTAAGERAAATPTAA
jgi:hypothetical protein